MWKNVVLFIGLVLSAPIGVFAELIPGTEHSVDSLVVGLDWSFSDSHESTDPALPGPSKDVWRFRSDDPYSVTDGARLFLRFSLEVHQFEEERGALAQFGELSQKGQGVIGLTYAWARVFQRKNLLYRLDIPCTFSKHNVQKMTSNLTKSFALGANESIAAIYCYCGGSCVNGDYSRDNGFRQMAGPDKGG